VQDTIKEKLGIFTVLDIGSGDIPHHTRTCVSLFAICILQFSSPSSEPMQYFHAISNPALIISLSHVYELEPCDGKFPMFLSFANRSASAFGIYSLIPDVLSMFFSGIVILLQP
jgi:hypothetical protein